MKKFWIFLLGIIVAVIGFHFFANKSESPPDNPPINNEQPGDNNQTPNPSGPDDVIGVPQYTTNTFNMAHCAANLYHDVDGGWVYVDVPNGFDNVQIVVGDRYNLHLYPHESYAITEVVYNNEFIWSGYHTDIYSAVSTVFTAVENGIFEVITQPVDNNQTPNPSDPDDVTGVPQYTTYRFNLNNVQSVSLDKYNPQTGEYDISVDLPNYLDVVQLELGSAYRIDLVPDDGYAITELIHEFSCLWSGYVINSISSAFTAVENGVFQATTQAIECCSVNNLVQCNAADYTCSFTDVNGNQVDALYPGQDYTFEISIHETDRIVTCIESYFSSSSYPNTQTAGFTFNMSPVDPNSPAIWVHTALTTETVNLVMGDITGVSVNITTFEGLTPETYYPGIRYQVEIIADADYNVLGFNVGENFTSFVYDPLYGGTSRYFEFNIPADPTGNVEFSVTTEYVGAE